MTKYVTFKVECTKTVAVDVPVNVSEDYIIYEGKEALSNEMDIGNLENPYCEFLCVDN